MPVLPHDIADLYLAPVVLELDARIVELGLLTPAELRIRVAIDGDRLDQSRDQREIGLLATIKHFIDCRGWVLLWDPRGIRVTRASNSIVLGVPPTFRQYLDGLAASLDDLVA
jgi:hypothetical protein